MSENTWSVLEEKRFVIPSIPPSVNTIYQIIFSQRRVEMKPDIRLWKTKAKEYIPHLTPLEDSYIFSIDVKYYYNWYYLNGNFKKFDTANLLKILIDAIAEKCGFDDSRVKIGSWESYNDKNEHVEVILKQLCLTP